MIYMQAMQVELDKLRNDLSVNMQNDGRAKVGLSHS